MEIASIFQFSRFHTAPSLAGNATQQSVLYILMHHNPWSALAWNNPHSSAFLIQSSTHILRHPPFWLHPDNGFFYGLFLLFRSYHYIEYSYLPPVQMLQLVFHDTATHLPAKWNVWHLCNTIPLVLLFLPFFSFYCIFISFTLQAHSYIFTHNFIQLEHVKHHVKYNL